MRYHAVGVTGYSFLGPKPDRISGSAFGFEVVIGIIRYLFLLSHQKPDPKVADIRSDFEPCLSMALMDVMKKGVYCGDAPA